MSKSYKPLTRKEQNNIILQLAVSQLKMKQEDYSIYAEGYGEDGDTEKAHRLEKRAETLSEAIDKISLVYEQDYTPMDSTQQDHAIIAMAVSLLEAKAKELSSIANQFGENGNSDLASLLLNQANNLLHAVELIDNVLPY